MDILLVNGRSRGPQPHPSRVVAAATARDLAAEGHAVRWLCPVPRGGKAEIASPEGVEVVVVETQAPRFRAVEAGLGDVPMCRALNAEIRRRLPDVVHVLAFGGVTAEALPWIADRLGAPAVVTVDPRELLCHRGTLVDETGASCERWHDPGRCAECCMSPFDGGLTAAQARRGAVVSRVLGRWSPYPKPVDFENRSDLVFGSLLAARWVIVRNAAERQMIAAAGVPEAKIRTLVADGVVELVALYRRASEEVLEGEAPA